MKIFFGTKEIAGFQASLVQGLRDLGVDAVQVELEPHPFAYATNQNLHGLARFFANLVRGFSILRKSIARKQGIVWAPARFLVYAIETLLRLPVFFWALFRFDVFVFSYHSNIIGWWTGYADIALLKKLGRRIIFIFHGSDSRPPYMDGSHIAYAQSLKADPVETLYKLTKRQKKRIMRLDQLAHVIIDNPATGLFHSRPFVDFVLLGIPGTTDTPTQIVVGSAPEPVEGPGEAKNVGKAIRILHAPSHPEAKGTARIRDAISKLREKGLKHLELIELANVPHQQVKTEIERCDFVVDQIYADYAMAGLAREAASFGKPAIVCGYQQDPTLTSRLPTHYCHPDFLEQAIEHLATDPVARINLGDRARQFANTEWSVASVAQRYKQIMEDKIPKEWLREPKELDYIHGWGLSENKLCTTVSNLVNRFGSTALCLDDKPWLRKKLLKLLK